MPWTAACFNSSSSCLRVLDHFHDWDSSAPEATGAYLCCFLSACWKERRGVEVKGEPGEENRLRAQCLESLYCVFY